MFWGEPERLLIALQLLEDFSAMPLAGPNASYIASCLEALLPSSNALSRQISCQTMKVIFHVGYQIPSACLSQFVEEWLDHGLDAVDPFTEMLLSCRFVWKSSSFSKFEAKIIGRLAYRSNALTTKLVKKLAVSDQNLDSIESILLLAQQVTKTIPDDSKHPLQNAIRAYLKKCAPYMERTVQEADLSDDTWNIVSQFVSYSDEISLEKWLGLVCKCDTEDLNPKACQTIQSILDKDPEVFHRLLPGWMVRALTRLTRRFAEDKTLSDSTLNSVTDFSMLPDSCR